LKTAFNVILWLVVVVVFIGIFAQNLINLPWGLNAIDGTSMEPTFKSDDAVMVLPFVSSMVKPEPGDIIVFERGEGRSLTIHRVVEITSLGITTQGDNLAATDQELGFEPVRIEDIKGFVPVIAGAPIVLPRVGEAADIVSGEYRLWVIGGLAALLAYLAVSEARKKKRRRWVKPGIFQRNQSLLVYGGIAAVFVFMVMSFLLAIGYQSGYIPYTVAKTEGGVSWGGSGGEGLDFGTIKVGTEKSELVKQSNSFWLPIVNFYMCSDPYIKFSENPMVVEPGHIKHQIITVEATEENFGSNPAPTEIVTCPRLLPVSSIVALAKVHPVLLMFVISLVPLLIVMVPFIIADRLVGRRAAGYQSWKRKWRLA
jgi:signal peptidase I